MVPFQYALYQHVSVSICVLPECFSFSVRSEIMELVFMFVMDLPIHQASSCTGRSVCTLTDWYFMYREVCTSVLSKRGKMIQSRSSSGWGLSSEQRGRGRRCGEQSEPRSKSWRTLGLRPSSRYRLPVLFCWATGQGDSLTNNQAWMPTGFRNSFRRMGQLPLPGSGGLCTFDREPPAELRWSGHGCTHPRYWEVLAGRQNLDYEEEERCSRPYVPISSRSLLLENVEKRCWRSLCRIPRGHTYNVHVILDCTIFDNDFMIDYLWHNLLRWIFGRRVSWPPRGVSWVTLTGLQYGRTHIGTELYIGRTHT